MVAIKLPDGSILEMESGVNGFDIANKISAGLAKAALAITVNGKTQDFFAPAGNWRLVILNAKEQIPRRMTGTRSIAFIFFTINRAKTQ